MPDSSDQPTLPFEPALQLVRPVEPQGESAHEVSFDAFANLLFQELARRSAALRNREQRSA